MTSRREFLRGGLGLSAIIASGESPAIVRSMVAARQSIAAGRKAYTARDYVQDGLILNYNGVESGGYGEASQNGQWVELAGQINTTQSGLFTFGKDYANFDGTVSINTSYAWQDNQPLTFEVMFEIDSLLQYIPVIDCTSSGGWTLKRESTSNNGTFFAARDINANAYRFIYTTFLVGSKNKYRGRADSNIMRLNQNEIVFNGIKKPPQSTTLKIGRTSTGTTRYFVGRMNYLRIYNRFITDKEAAHNDAVDAAIFNRSTT